MSNPSVGSLRAYFSWQVLRGMISVTDDGGEFQDHRQTVLAAADGW